MLGEEFPEVLAAAQAGGADAFARLWRDANPPLLRFLHSLDPDFADDAASEAWTEVCRNLHRVRDEQGLRAYLAVTGRRRVLDEQRRRARRRTQPMADVPTGGHVGAATEDVAADHEATAAAVALIRQLPPDQAQAVLLRVVVGLDAAAAGQVLGKRAGAVRVATHRGLRRLAELLPDAAAGASGVTTAPSDDVEGM